MDISQTFDKAELDLPNKGLKFALPSSVRALEAVVAHVERFVQLCNKASRGFVREACRLKIQQNQRIILFFQMSQYHLTYLEDFLKENSFSNETVAEYLKLASVCMRQNCFQVNGCFYKQQEGTAMGRFEKELGSSGYFLRIWLRYVDDIFAIFDENAFSLDDFVFKLNNCIFSFKFTFKLEKDVQLPFLKSLVIRSNNTIEFDIYRKPTRFWLESENNIASVCRNANGRNGTIDEIESAVKSWLRNAGDRAGGRISRKKEAVPNTED
ncbi:unnamed protein product [Brassicogethes aeneus]|uniref:Uncharacterized protein n=1 Tax=Brassicogethes aeneus TaxID=1431903 RepID=A0A9P0ASA0_BRAAE|nr:unnamed protein product [Brassicogethes aeneus]